jgi:hypothetical protein
MRGGSKRRQSRILPCAHRDCGPSFSACQEKRASHGSLYATRFGQRNWNQRWTRTEWDALISAVLSEFATYRSSDDIAAELHYLIDNLDEDTFVITRGC